MLRADRSDAAFLGRLRHRQRGGGGETRRGAQGGAAVDAHDLQEVKRSGAAAKMRAQAGEQNQ